MRSYHLYVESADTYMYGAATIYVLDSQWYKTFNRFETLIDINIIS
jgi:hypothetical protein